MLYSKKVLQLISQYMISSETLITLLCPQLLCNPQGSSVEKVQSIKQIHITFKAIVYFYNLQFNKHHKILITL